METSRDGAPTAPGLGESALALAMLMGALAVLMLFSGTILHFQLLGIEPGSDLPTGRIRALMMGSYGIICLLAATQYRAAPEAVLQCLAIIAFIGFLTLSALWSINPGASFRAGVALAMTTVFAVYLVTHYGVAGTMRLYLGLLVALMLLSAVLVVVAPDIALHHDSHAGAWRGYFTHKNVAGEVTIWALPATFFLLAAGKVPRWLGVAAVCLTIGFIVMTHSKTALVVAMAMVALYGMGKAFRYDIRATAIILLLLVSFSALVAFVLVLAPDVAVSVLGRDATFTGRTYIWSELQHLIAAKPWLGHGYSAIWDVTYGPLYRFLADWKIGSGHNSYLDLMVDVGFVGTGLFLALLLNQLRKAFMLVCHGDWAVGIFGLMSFVMIILLSFSETIVPTAHSAHWMFFVIAFMAVQKEYAQWRREGISQP
jgi:O-antigen ligase